MRRFFLSQRVPRYKKGTPKEASAVVSIRLRLGSSQWARVQNIHWAFQIPNLLYIIGNQNCILAENIYYRKAVIRHWLKSERSILAEKEPPHWPPKRSNPSKVTGVLLGCYCSSVVVTFPLIVYKLYKL